MNDDFDDYDEEYADDEDDECDEEDNEEFDEEDEGELEDVENEESEYGDNQSINNHPYSVLPSYSKKDGHRNEPPSFDYFSRKKASEKSQKKSPSDKLPNGYTRQDYLDVGWSETDIELWGLDQPSAPDPHSAGFVIPDMLDGDLDGDFDYPFN